MPLASNNGDGGALFRGSRILVVSGIPAKILESRRATAAFALSRGLDPAGCEVVVLLGRPALAIWLPTSENPARWVSHFRGCSWHGSGPPEAVPLLLCGRDVEPAWRDLLLTNEQGTLAETAELR